jgi:hypothetical protein
MNELPLSLDRFVPDSNVEADHDGDGKPERDHDSHDRHVLVGVNELEGINIDSLKSDLLGRGVYIQHTLVVTLHEMETEDYLSYWVQQNTTFVVGSCSLFYLLDLLQQR